MFSIVCTSDSSRVWYRGQLDQSLVLWTCSVACVKPPPNRCQSPHSIGPRDRVSCPKALAASSLHPPVTSCWRAETRRQSVPFFDLNWEHMRCMTQSFATLCSSPCDIKSATSIDLGIINNFQQVGTFAYLELKTNEDGQYL